MPSAKMAAILSGGGGGGGDELIGSYALPIRLRFLL